MYHYASLLQIAAEALGGVAIGSAIIETAPEYFLAGYDRWQLKLAVWTLQAPPAHVVAPLPTPTGCTRRGLQAAQPWHSLRFPFPLLAGAAGLTNQSIAVRSTAGCCLPVQALLVHAYARSSVATVALSSRGAIPPL